MPSTAPTATASRADDETALSTVETAQSTSRPRVSAIDLMLAIASFLHLLADRARDVLAAGADRRGRTDVRAGRHVGEVGRRA